MSSLPRLWALARRTAPFWTLWLLIFLLPIPRALLKMQIYNAPFTPGFLSGIETDFHDDPRADAFAAVRNRPGDLNARLWRLAEMHQGRAAGFEAMGERRHQNYPPAALLREAASIAAAFPREKWLFSLPFRVQSLGRRTTTVPGSPQSSPQNAKSGAIRLDNAELARVTQLDRLARRAAKIEPNNAFFPLLEAEVARSRGQNAAMWQALGRAAKCARLETHELEWARAQVEAREAAGPLLLEDKEILWQELRDDAWKPDDGGRKLMLQSATRAQRAGDHRRALSIIEVLLRVGDLMQRGQNTLPVAGVGQSWKDAAELLLVRSYPPLPTTAIPFPAPAGMRARVVPKPKYWAPNLAAYAAAHGRADLAPAIKRAKARQNQMLKLAAFSPWSGRWSVPSMVSATQKVGQWRAMGTQISAHLLLVAGFWLLLSAVLWRGIGRASTRPERVFPALLVAALSFGMALWSRHNYETVQMARLMSSGLGWSPTSFRLEIAVVTVGVFAFCAAPFLLAIGIAGATMWRHKAEFLKPARIESELRLAPPQMALLRSGPALICVAALLATLGLWLLFLGLMAFDVASFDLLGWLPGRSSGSSIGYTVPTETLLAPLGYCLLLDFLGFLGWLYKWRYGGEKGSRPLLHSGLRRWKEALGIYLVIGSAIYLGTSLGALPLRAAANRELEKRMVTGDLPV